MRRKIFLEHMLAAHAHDLDQNLAHDKQLLLLASMYSQVATRYRKGDQTLPRDAREFMTNVADFLRYYVLGEAKIYQLAERFGAHLAKTSLDVPCDALGLKIFDSFLIELPVRFRASDGYFHRSAIVNIGLWKPERKLESLCASKDKDGRYQFRMEDGTVGYADDPKVTKAIYILAPDYDDTGRCHMMSSYWLGPLLPGKTMGEMLEMNKQKLGESIINPEFIQLVAKTLLYIRSGEPDLVNEIPPPCLSKKPKKIKMHWREHCPLPVVNVGYGYHGRLFHKDATAVSGHFRWQPYGEGKAQVKLIWIDEHTRHFKTAFSGAEGTSV